MTSSPQAETVDIQVRMVAIAADELWVGLMDGWPAQRPPSDPAGRLPVVVRT